MAVKKMVRVSSKGQIVLPKRIAGEAGNPRRRLCLRGGVERRHLDIEAPAPKRGLSR